MQNTKLGILTLAMAIALTGCTANQKDADLIAKEATLAVNWVQQSGEYQALTYQAFNIAKQQFKQAKVAKGKKIAVVADLDETLINNSAYAAWQVAKSQGFSPESWKKWVNAQEAIAIPGAVDFANYVNSNGGTMFYVSNRKEDGEKVSTIENLKKLGFTGVNNHTVLLKTDKSAKEARFAEIEKQGYQIVLFLGDNLNDFGNATYHKNNAERRDFVKQNAELFGKKYIILPNPVYGDWEGGLAPNYFKLNAKEKLKAREAALMPWNEK
ncbi:5'-nucleotidase, lipoprotein e(P4) family [Mergibacter septicus]|uniref:5'-nucleotidase, lipoprotein e(P4) family n=1 Tax=Mergibacter septicus TaxID=221402 RepID=UPI001C76B27A|nr:5'-nucleotidase, lipoprotein e(P4) family [Mergibacter septicus]QDJ13895.1 5'-nucleotidase, lipoprotein e(P4) family [Mergibacter septicus]